MQSVSWHMVVCSLLSSCFLLSPIIPFTKAQSGEIAVCGTNGNFTQGSPYETNLKIALTTLASYVSLNGYYNTTSGSAPNHVYGLVQCRSDISKEACASCGEVFAINVLIKCPNQTEAHIYNDNCWLHYADNNFFSIPSTSPKIIVNGQDASDANLFSGRVRTLMKNLTSEAASVPSKFAAGISGDVNGLVQCSRDLSSEGCRTCLQASFDVISDCCGSKRGAWAVSTTCFLRYELYSFFQLSPPPPPKMSSVADSPPNPSPTPPSVDSQTTNGLQQKFAIGAAAAVGFVITTSMVIYCYLRRKSNTSTIFWKRKGQNSINIEAIVRDWGSYSPTRYKFSDIKKITNSLEEKIGQGGYGSVFKGKLPDGKIVAVKVLRETKGNGNEFINEVASISKTSHVNIVSLLGYCIEGLKRALIYEFMPNGSLEKFIYDENPLKTHPHLGWETLYKITIGIARGLEYLHRGCNTRILHFDIKPHNILLDQDFNPKISDFGLSKLSNVKESIVSMTGARGTPGYIAPEVVSRNIGAVSHKSDVYSYGMMVLEIVGGRRNLDVKVSNTSEIYFPQWIYQRLNLNEEMELHAITSLKDNEIARKMILVSLWCIQIDPLSRPSMSRVLEMLEGSLEALQIPPSPFLHSPSRSESDPPRPFLYSPSKSESDPPRPFLYSPSRSESCL